VQRISLESAAAAAFENVALLATVEEAMFGVGDYVFRKEPETEGNLRSVEKLTREGDHVVL
jgi:hypothetical protein